VNRSDQSARHGTEFSRRRWVQSTGAPVWMLKSTAFDEPPASARDRQRRLEVQCPAGPQLQLRAILVGSG
jgi:hypothetical protein